MELQTRRSLDLQARHSLDRTRVTAAPMDLKTRHLLELQTCLSVDVQPRHLLELHTCHPRMGRLTHHSLFT